MVGFIFDHLSNFGFVKSKIIEKFKINYFIILSIIFIIIIFFNFVGFI